MSLFDFLFPQQAQASHLRTLADQARSSTLHESRDRLREELQRRRQVAAASSERERIARLEAELGRAMLVIEALLTHLERSGQLNREELSAIAQQLDLADGLEDGRQTPPASPGPVEKTARPFVPNRKWEDA